MKRLKLRHFVSGVLADCNKLMQAVSGADGRRKKGGRKGMERAKGTGASQELSELSD
jgi:hypothetical protein